MMALSLSFPQDPDPRAEFLSSPAMHKALRAAVARYVPASEVEDVVQATLLEAQASPTYPTERKAFERWLCGKGRSNGIDWRRRQARGERILGTREGEDAEGVPGTSLDIEQRERLAFAVERILGESDKKGMRWLLATARGHTSKEIGAAEGVPEDTVKRAVHRARQNVRYGWIALAAIGLAVFFYLLSRGLLFGSHYHEAHPHPAPPVTQEPAPAPAPVAPSPQPQPQPTSQMPRETVPAMGSKPPL
jgi:DNA-directed RNA polymerase specialized sigma24 family protein